MFTIDAEHSLISEAISKVAEYLIDKGQSFAASKWQSVDAPDRFWEITNCSLKISIPPSVEALQTECQANQPWAEEQFLERVSGNPLNPGYTYTKWPFYKRDSQMRNVGGKFSHTYMERFWPKYAGKLDDHEYISVSKDSLGEPLRGIRYSYGDYQDVIRQLNRDSTTRQAFLPIWFPEDTGVVHNKRVPCSLGYLFYIRESKLHLVYYLRSCDFIRHFRDDIYLACRLAQHTCNELSELNLTPGSLVVHIANLHIFQREIKFLKLNYL
jgi:hypothetical protein